MITRQQLLDIGFSNDVWQKKEYSGDWGNFELSVCVGNSITSVVIHQQIDEGFSLQQIVEIINESPELANGNFVLKENSIVVKPVTSLSELKQLVKSIGGFKL